MVNNFSSQSPVFPRESKTKIKTKLCPNKSENKKQLQQQKYTLQYRSDFFLGQMMDEKQRVREKRKEDVLTS